MEPIHILFTVSGIIALIAIILYVKDIRKNHDKHPVRDIQTVDDVLDDLYSRYLLQINRMDIKTFRLFIKDKHLDKYYEMRLGLTEDEQQVYLMNTILRHVEQHKKLSRVARAEHMTFHAFANTKLYNPKSYFDFSMPGDGDAKCPKCGGNNTYCALKLTIPDEDLGQFLHWQKNNDDDKLMDLFRKHDPERLHAACRACEVEFDYLYKQIKI